MRAVSSRGEQNSRLCAELGCSDQSVALLAVAAVWGRQRTHYTGRLERSPRELGGFTRSCFRFLGFTSRRTGKKSREMFLFCQSRTPFSVTAMSDTKVVEVLHSLNCFCFPGIIRRRAL